MSEANDDKQPSTPGARWRKEGAPDPHGDSYDCERAKLPMGSLTDDELANAVFMHGGEPFNLDDVLAGKPSPIAYLTAAKERLRWLSRKLDAAQAAPQATAATDGIVVSRALLESLWESTMKARAYWDACERAGADVDTAAAGLEAAMAKAEWHCGQFNANGGLAQGTASAPCGGCGESDERKRCLGCMHTFEMAPADPQCRRGDLAACAKCNTPPLPPVQPKRKSSSKCVIERARLNGLLADAVRSKSAIKAGAQRIQELETENQQLRTRASAKHDEN